MLGGATMTTRTYDGWSITHISYRACVPRARVLRGPAPTPRVRPACYSTRPSADPPACCPRATHANRITRGARAHCAPTPTSA